MQVLSLAPVPVSSLLWRRESKSWQLAVVCKMTLQVRHGKLALARSHDPIHSKELKDSQSQHELRHAADVVPGCEGLSLTVSGQVYGKQEEPEVEARIAIGDFDMTGSFKLKQGTAVLSGWGPLATTSPSRKALLGEWAAPATVNGRLELPADFSLDFFHHAPKDQQLKSLASNASLTLENLHPDEAKVTLRLPDIVPQLFVQRQTRREEIPMRIQALHVDTRRTAITINWHGEIPLEDPDQSGRAYLAIAGAERRMTAQQLNALIRSLGGDSLIDDPPTIDSEQEENAANQTQSMRLDPPPDERNKASDDALRALGQRPVRIEAGDAEDFTVVSDEFAMATASKQASVPAWLKRKATPSPTPAAAGRGSSDQALAAAQASAKGQASAAAERRAPFDSIGAPRSRQHSATPWDPPVSSHPAGKPTVPQQGQEPAHKDHEPTARTPRTPTPPPLPPASASLKAPASASLKANGHGHAQRQPGASVRPPAPEAPPLSTATGPLPAASTLPGVGSLLNQDLPKDTGFGSAASPSHPPPLPRRSPLPAQSKLPVPATDNEAPTPTPAASSAKAPETPKADPKAPSRPIELLWFDQALTPLLRQRWQPLAHELEFAPRDSNHDLPAQAPELARDHHTHFGLLVGATTTPFSALEQTMREGVSADGRFTAPLVAVEGRLRLHFDQAARLRALTAVLKPYAGDDRKLEKALSRVEELVNQEGSASPASLSTQRHLMGVYGQGKHALPPKVVDESVDRLLLQQRQYDTRVLFGSEWLRCTLESDQPEQRKQSLVVYLPKELEKRLPLMNAFETRMIAEAHPKQDAQEPFAYALKAITLGRFLAF